ncbi:MAG: hypothetical protein K6E84_10380 [Lachnospiraceae bacterium]|nr:hypothetical protein [Lachnospiraceae bacterium]
MKKANRYVEMILAGVLAGMVMTGCGSQAEAPATAEPETAEAEQEVSEEAAASEETEGAAEEESGETQMANPWKECTEEDAKAACPRLFKAPEDAVVNGWSMMEVESNENGIPGPLVQMDFRMAGVDFCARAQYGVDENEDIAGMYYDWAATESVTLANWGGGNMTGKLTRYMEEGWTVDLLTWYDYEIGIAYSLSAEAEDLDGFDLQAVAEQMYEAANEPTVDMPADDAEQ